MVINVSCLLVVSLLRSRSGRKGHKPRVPELTVAEVCKRLGYEVKIVKE